MTETVLCNNSVLSGMQSISIVNGHCRLFQFRPDGKWWLRVQQLVVQVPGHGRCWNTSHCCLQLQCWTAFWLQHSIVFRINSNLRHTWRRIMTWIITGIEIGKLIKVIYTENLNKNIKINWRIFDFVMILCILFSLHNRFRRLKDYQISKTARFKSLL